MSNVQKDVDIVWSRLFDHRAFVQGEIHYLFREFEQKRKDKEVFELLSALENISEIRDFQLNRLLNGCSRVLPDVNDRLAEVINLCQKFHF